MSTSTAAPGEREPRVAALLAQPEPGTHLVELHDDDEHLAERVACYLAGGLRAGEPAIAIATEPHRALIARRLAARGVDVEAARASGALAMLDAEATLDVILVGGEPSPARVREHLGAALTRARAGGGAHVRAYGEMVDVLWRRGAREAALRLEELWTELAREHPFTLLCAYSMGGFTHAADRAAFEAVCRAHAIVIPTEHCAELAADPARLRELAALEQRALALEDEIARRTALEDELREALAREQLAREEAERAVRYNEQFTNMLGHDLRNPLGAIAMGATYITRSSPSEKIARSAARILASTDRMTAMVDQLLDFSWIRLGRGIPLRPARLDLAALLGRVKEELEAVQPPRAISLEIAGDTRGTWDPDRLLRVFSNVVGNAISHGAAGHGVTIRLDGGAPERVGATVHNAGAMPPETLACLFEPFRSTSRQHHTRGLGLGLFISKHIVGAHGGTIEATSTALDGTAIRIDLPREAPARRAADGAP